MRVLRIALTTVGALVALVGGAETATWGLIPLAASLGAEAPRLEAADAGPVDATHTIGSLQSTPQLAGASRTERTAIVDSVPSAPPTDERVEGARSDSGSGEATPVADANPRVDEDGSARSPEPALASQDLASDGEAQGAAVASGGDGAVGAGPS